MKGLKYQFKNICQDKLCILTFLLPIIIGLVINLLSEVSFSSISETEFYVIENDLSYNTIQWLQTNGRVTAFPDMVSLENAIRDPSTQAIGVLRDKNGIKTLLSGDELLINTIIGNTLPNLYLERDKIDLSSVTIISVENKNDALISLFIVITIVTAMFMGCTFNAMSIIGEKEDGIAFINEVLPMTKKEYMIQKIFLGYVGAIISTVLTACICIHITASEVIPLLLLIILSAFVAALIGLFIGYLSSGLMIGIIYIKIIMLLFLAPPILFYLTVPSDSFLYAFSYFFPSSAIFYGLMDILNGQVHKIGVNIIILFTHCLVWLLLFVAIEHNKQYKKRKRISTQ